MTQIRFWGVISAPMCERDTPNGILLMYTTAGSMSMDELFNTIVEYFSRSEWPSPPIQSISQRTVWHIN